MKKKSIWIAFGLVAVMTATAVTGALAFSDSALLATATETETAQTETAASEEDAETAVTEAAGSETAADSTESETEAAAETETETEVETETETEEESSFVAVAYQEENAWAQVAIINSAYVDTGVNIRSAADTESEILGYLYVGTAVWVIERGDVWTQFYSNGITGYVMSDYLLYDSDVAEIAEVYGAEGVRADWDGVNIYTSDDGATVKDTMDAGDVYQVVNDYDHWIEILYDEDTTAFVSSEDVTSVMLFEGATAKDEERVQLEKLYGVIWPEAESSDTYEETEAASAASSDSSGTTSSSSSTSSSGSSSSGSSSSGTGSSSSSSSGTSSSSSSSSGTSSSSSSSSGTSSSSSSSSTSSSSSSETTSTETTSTES
ncbi:MAG: SH3 domain-containing protein, partial [Lachnospiraceae bacterium]|nr:SH3 domain-containing protein [Lachnospiraceae bacterium]